jgi:uncharacterized protein with HEPN domain
MDRFVPEEGVLRDRRLGERVGPDRSSCDLSAIIPCPPQPLLAHVERPAGTGTVRHVAGARDQLALSQRAVRGRDFRRSTAHHIDEKTMDAVERCLDRISEAAIRLSPQDPALCPGIPWDRIRGIGNILRHDYGNVNPKIIWKKCTMICRACSCRRPLRSTGWKMIVGRSRADVQIGIMLDH